LFIFSNSSLWYSSAIDMLLVLMGSKHLIVSLNLGRSFMNGYSIPVLGMNMFDAALLIFWLSFLN